MYISKVTGATSLSSVNAENSLMNGVQNVMNPDEIFMIRWTTRADIARTFKDLGITKNHISPRDRR
jgi:hypothetical protein